MAQHDFNIDNQSAPAFRGDLNNALEALGTLSSGATAPATTYAGMIWHDTAANTLYIRSDADDAWIALGALDQSANTFAPAGVAELNQVQAEDDTSTVFGQVSGQRLGQAVAINAPAEQGFSQSFGPTSSEGYTVFPNGLIMQWGTTGLLSGTTIVTLPIAFPNAHITGVASPSQSSVLTGNVSAYYVVQSLTQCRITHDASGNSDVSPVGWIAIGY